MEVKVSQAEAVRNFYRKQGAEAERERIIKLLEPRLAAMGSDHCMCHTISAAAIRLIKGEK